MLPAVYPGVHPTIASSSSKGQFIRLEGRSLHITLVSLESCAHLALLTVISGKNIKVPSERIPAGIYISLHAGSKRRWKSTIGFLSSDESLVWADTVTL
jgi:hypothetical protein